MDLKDETHIYIKNFIEHNIFGISKYIRNYFHKFYDLEYHSKKVSSMKEELIKDFEFK